jgi:DNA polymerase
MSKLSERARRIVLQRLESLEQAGVRELPRATRPHGTQSDKQNSDVAATVAASIKKSSSPAGRDPGVTPSRVTESSKGAPAPSAAGWKSSGGAPLFDNEDSDARQISNAPSLEVLQQEVAACNRCEELVCTRTQTVFGVGNPRARLVFIGEAPGADEDRLGEPFVGRAGQLLDKIIQACKMRRGDVYICNILKCRPPQNRVPLPVEAANCRRFLERQLELVGPEFICCLGSVAAQNLLGTLQSIGKLRGKVHAYRGAKVICTYHPAYLLRNPAAKKDTWEDMKLLMREMGVELE